MIIAVFSIQVFYILINFHFYKLKLGESVAFLLQSNFSPATGLFWQGITSKDLLDMCDMLGMHTYHTPLNAWLYYIPLIALVKIQTHRIMVCTH